MIIKNKLKTVELFCGMKSFSSVAEKRGYTTWCTDINPRFSPDFVGDILKEECQEIIYNKIKEASVVWMSPDCTVWSLASGNTHWTEFRMPKTERALLGIKMMMFCRFIADYCIKHNKIFFIENTAARGIWILDNQYLKRVWYCQYGDSRAKPTDIWTNLDIKFKICFNGNKNCHHEKSPRGSKTTGTQGLKGSIERSIIPKGLVEYIFDVIEKKEACHSKHGKWK